MRVRFKDCLILSWISIALGHALAMHAWPWAIPMAVGVFSSLSWLYRHTKRG